MGVYLASSCRVGGRGCSALQPTHVSIEPMTLCLGFELNPHEIVHKPQENTAVQQQCSHNNNTHCFYSINPLHNQLLAFSYIVK